MEKRSPTKKFRNSSDTLWSRISVNLGQTEILALKIIYRSEVGNHSLHTGNLYLDAKQEGD